MKSAIEEILNDIKNMSLEDLDKLEKESKEMENSANKYGIQIILANGCVREFS